MAAERRCFPSRRGVAALAAGLLVSAAAPAWGAEGARNPALDLFVQMQEMQRELAQLRNQVEVQQHELEGLKKRQRELYDDLDRRVREQERKGVASAPVPASTARAAAPADDAREAREQQDYEAAFNLLRQSQYAAAIKAFREFLQRYPDGELAANALYWIGEACYVTRDFQTALLELNKLITTYPQSEKVPDALLKIGYTHYEQKAWQDARQVLNEVATRYPGTSAANLAETRLKKIQEEGH